MPHVLEGASRRSRVVDDFKPIDALNFQFSGLFLFSCLNLKQLIASVIEQKP